MEKQDHSGNLAEVTIEGKIRDATATNPITSSQAWMEVADVMSENVATIASDQSVCSAATIMSERNISCILVTDGGRTVGIVTETDLLKKVAARGEDFYEIPVSAIMSPAVEGVAMGTSVLVASQIMQTKQIKRLPVFSDEKLIGIVTQTDLTRALTHYGTWRDVAEIMSINVCEIQKGASVAAATRVMTLSKISSILIRSNDEVVGILTQRDIFKKVIAEKKDPGQVKVEEIMSATVISVPRCYSVFSASKSMAELKIRRLVVMEERRVFGIVTQTDIFNAVKNKLEAEEDKHLRLLNESKSCIFATNLQGTVTFVNPAFAQLFEVADPKAFINQPILPARFWIDPRQRMQFIESYKQWSFESDEIVLKTAQANKKYITVFSSFTTGAHGEINGREGIIYDTTERRLAEEQQAELLRQLEKTNSELEDFARTIERDLQMPLQDIHALLQGIVTGHASQLSDKARDALVQLTSHVKQMRDTMNSIERHSGIGFTVDE
jgi:CBS domain-containing protein